MPFQNNNVASGLPPTGSFRVGKSNVDDGRNVEANQLLPWASSPTGSYAYYDCTVGVMLDSGIVVHNRLPQVDYTADTLASIGLDSNDLDKIIDRGVNLKSKDQYTDIVQRMGHSRYWFRLWGQALRVGYKVPIPSIKTIGGVEAIPYDQNPQWAYNRIFPGGNYGGLILWHAAWSLWYTTKVAPTSDAIPIADAAAHISGSAKPPIGIQMPYTQADDNATTNRALSPSGPTSKG